MSHTSAVQRTSFCKIPACAHLVLNVLWPLEAVVRQLQPEQGSVPAS